VRVGGGGIQTDEIRGEHSSNLMNRINYLIWLITGWITRVIFVWQCRIILFVVTSRLTLGSMHSPDENLLSVRRLDNEAEH